MFALNCPPLTVRPQLFALNCLPSANTQLFYSDDLLKRFDHITLVLGSQAVCALRMLVHACIVGPQASTLPLMLVQCSHGLCFAGFLVASVELVDILSPPHLRATTQSALVLGQATIAGAIGNILWSVIYHNFGGSAMYCLASFVTVANIAATWWLMKWVRSSSPYTVVATKEI